MCMALGATISVSFFKKMFAIASLNGEQWLITVILMFISIIVFIVWCLVIGYLEKNVHLYDKLKSNKS